MRLEQFDHLSWQDVLDRIAEDVRPYVTKGKVADYIPALADAPADAFGMSFTTLRGDTFVTGDFARPFSIQSISKIFSLILALELEGEGLWDRVGREPSGTPFNSIVQLEREKGRPRNPFINAGAIVVTDSVTRHCGEEAGAERVLRFVRQCANSDGPVINQDVAASEKAYGDRNRALAYFMKSFGVVRGNVPEVLDTYFSQCAIEMDVRTLSQSALFLAGRGIDPRTDIALTNHERVDRVNAIMMLCGHYDRSGDFAFRVGLAGKSGVGGGIVAIAPDVGTVAVWSPGLNEAGNSHAGTIALEWFSDRTGINLF